MARRLPSPEVTEIELPGNAAARGAQLRGMGFDAGNPNVPPGGSAEAQAFRSSRAAPTASAEAPAPAQPRPYRLGFNAGTAVRAALPAATAGAGGAAVAGQVNALRQQALDDAPAFVPPPTAPGQIPGADPRYQAPQAAAGRLLDQTELGRNFGNTLMALPGGTGITRGLTTVAQAASRTAPATRLAAVAPVVSAGTRSYVAGDATMPGTPTTRPDTPAAVSSAYSNEGRNYPDAGSAMSLRTPDLTGKIVRDGNRYSGTDIKFGADIVDPRGNLVNGGDPNNPKGFGVSSLDTSAGYQADLRELGRLRADRAEREASFAANQPGGGLSGINGRTVVDDLVARDRASGGDVASMPGLSQRQRANFALQQREIASRRDIAEMGNAATLRGQDISAGVTTRGQDIGANTARRGQDMDYAEKIDARRMDLAARQQLRNMSSEILKAAGGDMSKAAALAAGMGISPDTFLAVAKYRDDQIKAGDQAIEANARSLSVGPDGKIVEGDVVRNKVALKTNNNLAGATPAQVAAAEPTMVSRQRLANNFDAARDTGYLQALGFDEPSLPRARVPDLRGYSAGETGFFEGLVTPNVGKGDFKFSKPGEKPIYLRRDGLSDVDLRLLRDEYGVTLPGR